LGEMMLLVDLLYAPSGSSLHSTLRLFSRIEHASHILAWTRLSPAPSSSHQGDNPAAAKSSRAGLHLLAGDPNVSRHRPVLSALELPRLKLTFTERKGSDGKTR